MLAIHLCFASDCVYSLVCTTISAFKLLGIFTCVSGSPCSNHLLRVFFSLASPRIEDSSWSQKMHLLYMILERKTIKSLWPGRIIGLVRPHSFIFNNWAFKSQKSTNGLFMKLQHNFSCLWITEELLSAVKTDCLLFARYLQLNSVLWYWTANSCALWACKVIFFWAIYCTVYQVFDGFQINVLYYRPNLWSLSVNYSF